MLGESDLYRHAGHIRARPRQARHDPPFHGETGHEHDGNRPGRSHGGNRRHDARREDDIDLGPDHIGRQFLAVARSFRPPGDTP
jgi:hypothetical protein